ncbi:MAG: hypothetical protein LKM31_03775 [Sphingobium sp.]|nr:hypothetical protein [Sphingobium sp.]
MSAHSRRPARAGQPQVLRRHERLGAQREWAAGLGYINIESDGEPGGPIAKNHGPEAHRQADSRRWASGPNDGVFFAAGKEAQAALKLAGCRAHRVGENAQPDRQGPFRFCWIVDFPFYEWTRTRRRSTSAHNPFSMPQGGMEALEGQDPLTIKAFSMTWSATATRSPPARSVTSIRT